MFLLLQEEKGLKETTATGNTPSKHTTPWKINMKSQNGGWEDDFRSKKLGDF